MFLQQKDVAQIANAGPNQHIYLSQTATVVLDGSKSSGNKFTWRYISTDYPSPAKIISPDSKKTTVTGLLKVFFITSWRFQKKTKRFMIQ